MTTASDIETGTKFSLALLPEVLAQLLQNARAFAWPDDDRPLIAALQLEVGGGVFRTVSTDSYRFFVQSLENVELDADEDAHVLLPRSAVKTWVKLLRSSDPRAVAKVTYDGDTLTLTCDGNTLTSRPLQGALPDYTQIVPSEDDYTLELAAFNPEYLGSVRAVYPPLAVKRGRVPVRCLSMSATKASVWESSHGAWRALFFVMPVRLGDGRPEGEG